MKGADYLADHIPDAELAVVEGARHAPNLTHAAEFDTRLVAFLDGRGL